MPFKRLAPVALLISALLLGGCTSANSSNEEASSEALGQTDGREVTLGLTYIPNVQFAPAYVGVEEGYFAAEGAEVSIRHHGADEGLFTALLAKEEDLVVATADEMMIARSTGMDLVSVGQYYARYPVVTIVKADSDITSFEDLKGKKVGLPGEFGSNWYGLLSALDAHDMSPSDIQVTAIGYTQLAALQSGQVDAVIGFTNNDTVQFGLAGVEVRELAMSKEGEIPLVGANVVTTAQFAKDNPHLVRAVIQGLRLGKQLCIDDPDRAVEITGKYDPNQSAPGAKEAAKVTLMATNELFANEATKASMVQDLAVWEQMRSFLAKQDGLLTSDVTVADAVTNEYTN